MLTEVAPAQPSVQPAPAKPTKAMPQWVKVLGLLFFLYLFIAGITGMGEAFHMFGEGFANSMLGVTRNPVAALLMGLLATSVVQSSSTTSSIVVGMVAGGVLDVTAAVPMIMGANIGTTITAMIVSLGSMKHPVEFERAFAASLLHLLFNLITVAVLFPLQASFDALTHVAEAGHGLFAGMGGMHLANPLKMATAPAIALLKWALFGNAILLLLVTIAMTYVALGGLVAMLRKLVLAKVEAFFDKVLFRDWRRAMAFGAVLTFAIQTSSVSTSLVNPLVGAGVLKVGQVFPFILGTNVGTTITAFLAALATGQRLPIIVAFTHVAFNIIGILIVWPFPPIRRIPLAVAQGVAAWAAGARYRPLAIIAVAYFVAPLILLFIVS